MSDMMDYLGELFIHNIFTERILHDCLQGLLRQPSALRIEAAAYLLHIVEPAIEQHLHGITREPSGCKDACIWGNTMTASSTGAWPAR